MIYDYQCDSCGRIQEYFHGMLEKPTIICAVCKKKMFKLIGTGAMFCGVNGRGSMYNFVDFNTTGQPVVINSKTQWRNHLKAHGLNDDVKNDPYTKSELEAKTQKRTHDKEKNRKEIKKSVTEIYKQRKTSQFKQRVKEVTRKGEKNG